MLIATTWKRGPPSLACKPSSAGISLRQGTHQVAHRLSSTARPRHSSGLFLSPAPSRNARSGTRRGAWETAPAATSPRASGAMRRAVSTAGPQAASASLRPKPPIPYTAASTAAAAAAASADRVSGRRRAAGRSSSRRSVIGTAYKWTSHEQQDVGRSEEHTSELQSLAYLVCRLLLEKKK